MAQAGRTRSEQVFDANYGRVCAGLEARLFSRIAGTFQALELIGGTSAVSGLLSQHQALTIGGGLLIAVVPILNYVLQPTSKAAKSAATADEFARLLEDASDLSDEEFEKRLRSIQRRGVDFVEALRFVAYNCALDEAGHGEGHYALTRWQRFVQAFA